MEKSVILTEKELMLLQQALMRDCDAWDSELAEYQEALDNTDNRAAQKSLRDSVMFCAMRRNSARILMEKLSNI